MSSLDSPIPTVIGFLRVFTIPRFSSLKEFTDAYIPFSSVSLFFCETCENEGCTAIPSSTLQLLLLLVDS